MERVTFDPHPAPITRLRPAPGRPWTIYGADIHAEILAALTAARAGDAP